jgi:putative aminopeptidase FrvX
MELRTLTDAFGPSGHENPVRTLIRQEAEKRCDDVSVDKMGNLICRKPGRDRSKPTVAVAAHMDEIGFIVVGHTEDGLLRFRPIGGIDPRVVVSKWVMVGDDRIPGVIGAPPIHLQEQEDLSRVLRFDKLFIDIGAKDQKEAESLAPLGCYAVFDTPYMEFGDGFVAAKALDDRVGCFNLLKLLEGEYDCDLICVFVTQEEVGLRGSHTAAYSLGAEIAVVLEGTAANDLGDVEERFHVCTPGKGVCVSFMDRASIADRELFKTMLKLSEEQGIPAQVKRGVTGGNDAASFQLSGRGARTVVLSVPCRYIHSANNVAKMSDIRAQADLAHAFLKSL